MKSGRYSRAGFLSGLLAIPPAVQLGRAKGITDQTSARRPSARSGASDAMLDDAAHNSLARSAVSSGRYFGAAARIDILDHEPQLKSLILRDCTHITPEIHLKWDSVEWVRGSYNLAPIDSLLTFADQNGLTVRGHTLLWDQSTPEWAKRELLMHRDWKLIAQYFGLVLQRYRGQINDWDVINEPIDTEEGLDGLRLSTFHRAFGPTYIERALAEARTHAPSAHLMINDYGFDYENPVDARRRAALLTLLKRLKRSGTPLGGVGIQAHLDLSKGEVNVRTLRDFVRRIADFGLDITITELDVKEDDLRSPVAVRDARVADHTRRYLEAILVEPAVRGVVTWGISDRYSWLSEKTPIGGAVSPTSATAINRGLPYDEEFAAKPMYAAINQSLIGAGLERGPSTA